MESSVSVFKTPQGQALCHAAYDAVLSTWPVPYKEVTLESGFGLTHLLVCGPSDGRPIVLLHGQEASATMWIYNIEALSRAHCVYAIDTPGDFGKSQPARLPANREEYAAWLLEILDQLHLGQADLAGMSYGGFLAANLACAYPERVSHLILLAPGIPNFGPPTLRWAYYGMPMLMMPSRFTVRRFIQGASVKGYKANDPVQEQMIVGVPHMRHLTFLRPSFTDEELRQIQTPGLLLLGDHEILYDPARATERACRLFPNLKAVIVPRAGHLLNSDQPEVVDRLIEQFLVETVAENEPA